MTFPNISGFPNSLDSAILLFWERNYQCGQVSLHFPNIQILLKGLCRDYLVHFVNNANRASLFAMELEKLRVNGKITPLYVSGKLSTYPSPETTLTLI